MRRLAVVGAMIAGLLVSGCSTQGGALDEGWSSGAGQESASARGHDPSRLAEDPKQRYVNLDVGVAVEESGDNEMAAKHDQGAVANGAEANIHEVAQDGNVAPRATTVAKIAQENLACLGSNICQAPR